MIASQVEQPTAPAAKSRRDLVSVVVISYNRAGPLLTALRSVARMETGGAFDVEVLVVDNASTDNTAEVIEQFAAECPFPVRRVYEPQAGIPFARNCGVAEASGDWICFFDDDQTAEPDWVLALYRRAIARQVQCVGGARDLIIEGGLPAPESEICRRLLGEVPCDPGLGDYHRRWLPNTGNVLIHRSVFHEVGRFDELALEGGDDSDFFNRYLQTGRTAAFAHDSLTHHHIPANRATDDYLQWVAMRHGVVMARRDVGESKLGLAWNLIARTGQAALVLFPKWAWLRLQGKKALALGPLCRMRRYQGYVKFVRHILTPRSRRGDRALGSFHHRNSAATAQQAAGQAATNAAQQVAS